MVRYGYTRIELRSSRCLGPSCRRRSIMDRVDDVMVAGRDGAANAGRDDRVCHRERSVTE